MARGDAGFKYTDPDTSKEVTVRLQGELRDVSKHEHRQRFTRWSLDGTARDVVTVGSRLHEVLGTARYQSHVAAFAKMLDHGLSGVELTYYPSLASTVNGIPCQLVSVGGSNDVSFSPDPDTWFRGEHTTDLVLRRTDGDTFDELLNPIVLRYYPGASITHSRADASPVATYVDRSGVLRTVASPGDLRSDHWRDGTRYTLLELASTNLLTQSDDFSLWTATGATVTAGQADPEGGTGAYLVDDNTTATAGRITRPTGSFTGDGKKAFSVFIRENTSPAPSFALRDTTTNVDRAEVTATWGANGVPVLSISRGAGTVYDPVDLGGGWWWVSATANGVIAANMHEVWLRPDVGANATNGGGTYFFRGQAENREFPTSSIRTAGSVVTRAAETAYSTLPAAIAKPTALALYVRFIERGTRTMGAISASPANIGGEASRYFGFQISNSNGYRARHHNGTSAVDSTQVAVPAIGDLVELVGLLHDDGSVTCIQSINGGTPTAAGRSAALPLASGWGADRFDLNARAGNRQGAIAVRDAKIVYRGGRVPYEGLTASALLQKFRGA